MEGMIVGAVIRNPFEPHTSREVRTFPVGMSVADVLSEFYPSMPEGYDVTVAVDGLPAPDSFSRILGPGQSVVFCATPKGDGGKDILGLVAMLAILTIAPEVGLFAQASITAAVGGTSYVTGQLIFGAAVLGTVVAGGLVVSALTAPHIPDVPGAGSFDNSPTYSWTPGGNTVVEGGTLPELLGTHRVTPPLIGKYIETTGDKQYLNLLYAVAGVPLDSIGAVRVNDTPLEYYEGATAETRLGSVTQPVLQYFKDTRSDVAVGAKLTWPSDWDSGSTYSEDDLVTYGGSHWKSLQDNNTGHTPVEGSWWTDDGNWTTRTTTGTAVRGIGVTLSLPKGLYFFNSNGGTDQQTVKVHLEYKKVGDGTWTRYEQYAQSEISVSVDRWSGGYWTFTGGFWRELIEGSQDPEDHTEGEVYEEAQYGWIDQGEANPEYGIVRPAKIWRWVTQAETVFQTGALIGDYAVVQEAQTAPLHRVCRGIARCRSGEPPVRERHLF
jgi:hypothetical protein